MFSSPFLLLFFLVRFAHRHMVFDTIVVDRARDEKQFVITNLPKATPPFAVQGP
jgi:hypothetical protein